MKKMVTLCTVLALAIALASCGGGGGGGGGGVDTTPPTVVSITPANNSTNVATTGNIVITFSELMDGESGTVKLDASPYPGSWDTAKKVYTVPYANLGPGITVTITVSGFKDEAGNVMTAPYTSAFTTAGGVSANATAGLYDKDTIGDSDVPLVAFDKNNAATTFNAAITKALADGNSYTLVLDGNVSLSAASELATVTLRVYGKGSNITITRTGTGSLFTVGLNAKLALQNITLQGNTSNTAALVTVNANNAQLYMYNGSAIKDNTNTSDPGGGVAVTSGTFTMKGGEISGNKAVSGSPGTHRGGGVYVGGSGKFFMEDGDIKTNTALGGCGVDVYGGEFTMSGGKISGNIINTGGSDGIGVGVSDSGKFTMSGGEISGNNSTGDEFFGGGGVSVSDSATFTMSGGEIKNNILSGDGCEGGGVYVYYGGIFNMSGGKITGNKATSSESYGGGVFVQGETDYHATFTMTGGEISGNTAGFGGGVFVNQEGTFTMSGESSIIKTNTANIGGGVDVAFGEFTMNGGKISSNIITDDTFGSGGGVIVSADGTFTMKGGEISGNTVSYRGGGVYAEGGQFIMKGGEIYNNRTADTNSGSGGGVFVLDCFDMEGGKIYNNTAGNGGGVYLEGTLSSYFNMKGGEIYGNTAAMMGGGVCLCVGKFQMAGGTIYGTNEADTSKRNKTTTANQGAALNKSSDSDVTAKYGTFNSSGVFSGTAFPGGTGVQNFENTIKVVNGALVP